jgi:hypothetical protein
MRVAHADDAAPPLEDPSTGRPTLIVAWHDVGAFGQRIVASDQGRAPRVRYAGRLLTKSLGVALIKLSENNLEDVVSVEGVVRLATDLGVFLDTQGRRVFLPANCMGTPAQAQIFEPGKVVTLQTLQVFRWYAKQEALVALASARLRLPAWSESQRLAVELRPSPQHEKLRA